MINLNVLSEHTIDLQLVIAALEDSGFCTAFDAMIKTAEPYVDIDRTTALQDLRSIANHPDGVFWCDDDVNADVRVLTSFVTVSAQVQ